MNLENNRIDYIVSLSKAVTGLIPDYGSLVGELIGNIVPNQRIDRIAKYVKELESRLSKIPIEKINRLLNNEEFIDLIEEGFYQASRAITAERRAYIINIIINGIEDEDIELIQSKQILKILMELNDIEIIWLRFYLDSTITGDVEFREKNKNILREENKYKIKEDKELINLLIQNNYKEHLERLNLIYRNIKLIKATDQPKFDRVTGKPETSYISITTLGRLLLKQLGLVEQLQEKNEIKVNFKL